MTCWPGVSDFITSSDSARSRTRARKSSTTSTETSASSSAVRISSRPLSTCFGCNFPRDLNFLKTASKRPVRVSNTRKAYRTPYTRRMNDVETERLLLRQWRDADLESWIALCADANLWRYPFGRGLDRE